MLLEKAAEYILGMITEDETVKNFPKEFISESAKWIRSWFLKDDPKMEAKINDLNTAADKKKAAIEYKLEDFQNNAPLFAELEARIKALEHMKTTKLNVIEGGTYKIQGNTHIGTVGEQSNKQVDEENVIKNANFEVTGDFRLGNTTTNIVHNYFGNQGKKGDATPPQYSSLKNQIETLVAEGKTEKAIETFLDSPDLDNDLRNSLLLQSGSISNLNRQVNNGVLTFEQSKVERARINAAILALTKDLK